MSISTARRILEANGYRLIKSRKRRPTYYNEGGYCIVVRDSNLLAYGDRCQLTFEDVVEWINDMLL